MKKCANCAIPLQIRHKIKFCSNTCQHDYQHQLFIDKWKRGYVDGIVGKHVRAISTHVRRYLIENNNEKCSQCGWSKRHSITGKVPLEIDHIDGNAENNIESNLRVLCPNCHSLTAHFRNLNKGNGRTWRSKKL